MGDNIMKNMVRVGRVSSIDPAKGTARVYFAAHGLVSYDLQVVARQTLANKDYHMPDVGENVLCLFMPTGVAEGFILGAVYSDSDSPPVTDPNKRTIIFDDGTKLEYDRSTHTLDVDTKGPINIKTTGPVKIETTGTAEVTAQSAQITASDTVSISGAGGITLSDTTVGVTIVGKNNTESW